MKILVGYNGSVTAKVVLEQAVIFARIFNAKVIVITSTTGGSGEDQKEVSKSRSGLDFAKDYLTKKNIPCETHELARGFSPGEDIVKFAKDNDINQIFVGIEKTSKTRKLLMGSTAQYVVLKAHCPVITVNHSML